MKLLKPIAKTVVDLATVELTYGKTSEMKDQKDFGDKLKSVTSADANNVMSLAAHELLDRFELLYPENTNLADLRRAYIDKDLTSIFRLVTNENKEDLRKLILEENMWKLWPLLKSYQDTQFVHALKTFYNNNTSIDADCFSRGQLRSKLWLVSEIKKLNVELGTVFLCAGWYAVLAVMLFENNIKIDKIRSFDLDPATVSIAQIFNIPWVVDNWKFKAIHQDILEINYETHVYNAIRSNGTVCELQDTPDTIINTSCEHIKNFKQWYDKIPNGKLLILQANDFVEVEEHTNCYVDVVEFKHATPMSTVLFEGELQLEKYKRFMRIGYK